MRLRYPQIFALALALVFATAKESGAEPLNPNDFASLGTLYTGIYTITENGGIPMMYNQYGLVSTGVLSNGVAVFDYDSIRGVSLDVNLNIPVAMLSRTFASYSDVTVEPRSQFGPGQGGQGQSLVEDPDNPRASGNGGSGGGGFGTEGGHGETVIIPGTNIYAYGGIGGASYGDLHQKIQMGSPSGGGAAGGGATELGALDFVTFYGLVSANGQNGGTAQGGGSGGAIYVHAPTIEFGGPLDISSSFSVRGGKGGPGDYIGFPYNIIIGAGGDGGDGRILLQTVPEPSTIVLSSLAALGLLGVSWVRKRRTQG